MVIATALVLPIMQLVCNRRRAEAEGAIGKPFLPVVGYWSPTQNPLLGESSTESVDASTNSATTTAKGRIWTGVSVTSLFAVILVVSYGCIRPAYDAFYSRLGLTPEDVGLDEKYVIFRATLNITRELLFLLGLVALSWLVERGAYLVVRQFGLTAPRISRVASVVIALLVAGAGCFIAYSHLHPQDRTATLIGFAAGVAIASLACLLLLSGRRRVAAVCVAALCLALGSYGFQYYLDAARLEGLEFMRTGRVVGTWGFVLAIPYHAVQPVALHGDPAQICLEPGSYTLLGSSPGSDVHDYILVQKPDSAFIARLSRRDYEVRLGSPVRGIVTCIK